MGKVHIFLSIIYQDTNACKKFWTFELLFLFAYAIILGMELNKEKLTAFAKSLGFTDIRFVDPGDMRDYKDLQQPRMLFDSASCTVVLFAPYRPTAPPQPGSMALSAYYITSHSSYHAARAVADYINQHGEKALHTVVISAKGAALKAGGFLGDNGFYYHPVLGSYVCIQTVLTDAFEPDEASLGSGGCLHCGACATACPSHAVGDIEKCLRNHLNGSIPEALRSDVYQLLGCEKCQSACPLNDAEQSETVSFPLEELLRGEATKTLRELAGANMARRGRLISQGALYAAATGQTQLIDCLKQLAENEGEPIRTHARWAADKLNGENK
jgi:epoxyqueuosine reductase QueG